MQVKISIQKTFDINDEVRGVIVTSLKNALCTFSRLDYSYTSSVFEALTYKMTPDNHDSVRAVVHSAMASINPESVLGPASNVELLTALKEVWDTKPLAYVWPVLLTEAMQAAVAEGLPYGDNKRKGLGDWLWDSFR